MSRFGWLSKIAKLMLVLPHSNAVVEFPQMVGLNKIKTRNALALDGNHLIHHGS